MRPLRLSVIGSIAYLALAGSWLLVSSWRASPAAPLNVLQTYKDFIFIAVGGIILGIVIYANTRKFYETEERRAKTEDELRRQQSQLNTLIPTLEQVKSEQNLPAVLASICRAAASSLGVEAAALTLYNPQRAIIELAAIYGLPESLQKRFKEIPFSASYLQRARQEKPLILSAEDSDVSGLPHAHLYRESNFKTLVYLPLLHDQDFLGELAVMGRERGIHFTPDQLTLLKAFADLSVMAILNDHLSPGLPAA